MNDLDKRLSELPDDVRLRVGEIIQQQNEAMLDRIADVDKRLTTTNFLTNGGGAVAIMAFLSQSNGAPWLVRVSLLVFTLGVIMTAVELRTHLQQLGKISQDTRKRNRQYSEDLITVRQLAAPTPEDVGGVETVINHWAGWLFIGGVAVAAYAFLSCV
jgi:hypothetical protein